MKNITKKLFALALATLSFGVSNAQAGGYYSSFYQETYRSVQVQRPCPPRRICENIRVIVGHDIQIQDSYEYQQTPWGRRKVSVSEEVRVPIWGVETVCHWI